jgi:hypothetical protein
MASFPAGLGYLLKLRNVPMNTRLPKVAPLVRPANFRVVRDWLCSNTRAPGTSWSVYFLSHLGLAAGVTFMSISELAF